MHKFKGTIDKMMYNPPFASFVNNTQCITTYKHTPTHTLTHTHLPKAPYVLTILKGSKEVFMAWRDERRFTTTGRLRKASMIPTDTLTALRVFPEEEEDEKVTREEEGAVRHDKEIQKGEE